MTPSPQKKLFATLSVLAALTLPLAACGDDQPGEGRDRAPAATEDGTGAPAASGGGPGTYKFEWNGATGTVEIPVDPSSDPELTEIENLRSQIGGEPVTYMRVTVDNTDGAEEAELIDMTVVTDTGEQVAATQVWQTIGDWTDLLSAEVEEEWRIDNDIAGPLYNKHLNRGDVLPGAKSTVLYASWGPSAADPKRVFLEIVYDTVEAKKS